MFSLINWSRCMKIDFYDEESGLDIDRTIANPDEYHKILWDIVQTCAARIESDDILNSLLNKKVEEYMKELQDYQDELREYEEYINFQPNNYPRNGFEDFEDEIYNHGNY